MEQEINVGDFLLFEEPEEIQEDQDEIQQEPEEDELPEDPKEPEESTEDTEKTEVDNTFVEEDINEDTNDAAKAYYDLLVEEGILEESEEFKGSFESLREVQQKYIQNIYDSAASSLVEAMPEKLKMVVQAGLSGVDDIDNIIERYQQTSKLSLDTEEGQKQTLRYAYKLNNYEDEDIERLIDQLEDEGKIQERAEKAKSIIDNYEQKQIEQAEEAKKQAQKEQQERVQEFVSTTNKVMKEEFKWNDTKTSRINDFMYKPEQNNMTKFNQTLTQVLQDPKNITVLADFLYHYNPKNKAFDLDKYKKVETKVARKVKDAWEEKLSVTQFPKNSKKLPKGADIDIDDFLS